MWQCIWSAKKDINSCSQAQKRNHTSECQKPCLCWRCDRAESDLHWCLMRNKFYKLNKYIGLLAEAGLTLEGRRSRQTESLVSQWRASSINPSYKHFYGHMVPTSAPVKLWWRLIDITISSLLMKIRGAGSKFVLSIDTGITLERPTARLGKF